MNGRQYNFTTLRSDKYDWFIPTLKSNIWLNMCRPTITQTCGNISSACQVWDPNNFNGHSSIGQFDKVEWVSFASTTIIGHWLNPINKKSFEIHFNCDPKQIGFPIFIFEQHQNRFIFLWNTSTVC